MKNDLGDTLQNEIKNDKNNIVVIGMGMVGQRFCEKLKKYDKQNKFNITCIGEEPVQHYNRMLLTEYFEHRKKESLYLAPDEDWYSEQNITMHIGCHVMSMDTDEKTLDYIHLASKTQHSLSYDYAVYATGSSAFVPPVSGSEGPGIFVYRTILDLDQMISYTQINDRTKRVGIIGGGLLGLEAAKALRDLGLQVYIIERNPRLMPRQIDAEGSKILIEKVQNLGINVELERRTKSVVRNSSGFITALEFEDGTTLNLEMVVFATGIRPRDELAQFAGIKTRDVKSGGGISVNDLLETSATDVFAIGECVVHDEKTYGLVAPGYSMADTVAKNMTSTGIAENPQKFTGADLSTKLKLLGVEVASFGKYGVKPEEEKVLLSSYVPMVFNNPSEGIYKKLYFTKDNSQKLVGGILVGDASEYPKFLLMVQSATVLKESPSSLLFQTTGKNRDNSSGTDDLPDGAQVCSCNDVTKKDIRCAVQNEKISSLKELKACTNAGTGCGGCLPLVNDIMTAELRQMGCTVTNSLCEHFTQSRQELFDIIRIKDYRTFTQVFESYGNGKLGCEICKPTIASILASLYNSHILQGELFSLQDSNDRFLANLQKNGTYSVIPRIPGGEITPDKLRIIADVAKKYNLYSKITGGQRIDLLGASAWQLPDIWEDLINAGFESGHAYGKALRTVKSCVGSAWCRFGRGDAVSFAIELEERYRGIRSPHKLKGAVSGCVRECAEAQGKDFGLIATEGGYNLYVGGNGGTTPKHAQLLATDISKELVVSYLDRFLMYYVHTAKRLERTSKWLGRLEGGIEQLRRVVIDDTLGLASTLEEHMALLIGTYQCEWKTVVNDPAKRALFAQFRNTSETQDSVVLEHARDQIRPVMLNSKAPTITKWQRPLTFVDVGPMSAFKVNTGGTILYGATQLAVFRVEEKSTGGVTSTSWYTTQNMCPHTNAFVLSNGILGSTKDGLYKVACPLHKATFALDSGDCLSSTKLPTLFHFTTKEENGRVLVLLPEKSEIDDILATSHFMGESDPTSSCGTTACSDPKLDW